MEMNTNVIEIQMRDSISLLLNLYSSYTMIRRIHVWIIYKISRAKMYVWCFKPKPQEKNLANEKQGGLCANFPRVSVTCGQKGRSCLNYSKG